MASVMIAPTRSFCTIPLFLAPAFESVRIAAISVRCLSQTSSQQAQKSPDRRRNRGRGVSAIRMTGPRGRLSVDRVPLPQPVKDPSAKRNADFPINQDHGLFQFFNENRDTILPAGIESSHGRAWTVRELSKKSFDDLWKLHWVCVKEANSVATRRNEGDRLKAGYGIKECDDKLKVIRRTMYNIKQVLLARYDTQKAAEALLGHYFLTDIFPDCERELGLDTREPPTVDGASEFHEDHHPVNPISSTEADAASKY